ncbi:MAG: hypothetical protein ACK5I7_08965 [Anaerotignum sp.]
MSAFLGPIHYWLYRKIQLQEKLTDEMLASITSEAEIEELEDKLKASCEIVEKGDLEDVIDTGNIHGWLQNQIGIAEKRFAVAVTEILHKDPSKMELLKERAFQLGCNNLLANSDDAKEIYQGLHDMLLEGMPCDHVNEVLEQDAQRVSWRQTVDLHLPFWNEIGGNIEQYYLLRNAFVLGTLSGSCFGFKQVGEYFIVEEA